MPLTRKKEHIKSEIRMIFEDVIKYQNVSNHPSHIQSSLDYIHTHCFDNNFTICKLRKKISGGKNNNLSSDFSYFIGEPPKSYLITIRIKTSKLLLVKKRFHNIPIYMLARELGFSGKGAFHHAFTEREGISPGKWRKIRIDRD